MGAEGAFLIREVSGLRREVKLEGRARPLQPFDSETTHTLATARYPGSSIKTTQALGASDEPVVLNGVVKDSWFSDGYCDQLKKLLRAICAEGEVCELETLDWVRRGQVKRVKIGDRYRGAITYEIEIEILNTADPETTVSFEEIETPDTEVNAPATELSAVSQVRDAAPVGTSLSAFAAFDEAMGTAQAAIDEAVATVSQSRALTEARRVLDSSRRVFALVQTVRTQGEAMRTVLRGLTPSTSGVLSDGMGVLAQATYLSRLRTGTQGLVSQAGRSARYFEELSLEKVRTTIVWREGRTLADLALRFYGDPHSWPRIARANGLARNLLATSATLVIPD